MQKRTIFAWLLAGVATATLMPADAQAATDKENQLEARIEALERAFGSLQGELSSTKAENAELRLAVAKADTKATEAASMAQANKPAPAPIVDGFTVGNGGTRIKLGGFLKTVASFSRWSDGDVAANTLGRDFYLPQSIPVGGVRESTDNDFSAKQTRLWMNLETQVAGHTLKGYIETDFQTAAGTQGTERTTNGYDLALRRVFVQYDKLTIGQDWSTFQFVGALPESTDFVGPTEGTVFVRQPLVRYSMPIGKGLVIHASVENPETAMANQGAPALIENDDDSLPDFAARLNYNASFGELSLAGLLRQLSFDNGGIHDEVTGYGASVAGKIFLDSAKRYDLRFMATYGQGIGRYVGINFAPDAVLATGTNQLRNVETIAGLAALRLGWTPKLRSTLMASYQEADYASGLSAASTAAFNKSAWSVAGNLFWSPAAGFDLGVEYRHGVRRLVSGVDGKLDRVEFAAKYSF
ncbi:DcaP family trimeric outer membrane transporter [Sphingorhabdus sp.]|uniref:DcaP family trimeric outer membrane transporter n=1 Tax=Sphingorhabdus sp. TaxID=1902408 RepID=UPI00391B7760